MYAARQELQQVQGLVLTASIPSQRLTFSFSLIDGLKDSVTIITRSTLLWQTVLPTFTMAQTFNMWPLLDTAFMANALNVSQTCVTALRNATVGCDPTTFRMAGQIDLYFWENDNISTLCTSDCMTSATTWINSVYDNCDPTDAIYVDTKLVPVDTVAVRYTDGLGLACLTDQQINITSTILPDLPSNDTDTSTSVPESTSTAAPATTTTSAGDPSVNTNGTYEYNYSPSPNFCFNQSQSWVGIDIPDCNLDPDNSLCADATEGMRIANYYNDTFLCDPCYLSVFWWRINSPFLPDSDYSDYLVDQFQDIQDVCNVTVSDTLLRISPPGYALGATPNYTLPGSTPSGSSPASSACLGQTLSSGSGACDTLSTTYGVTTGDLQQITNSTTCTFSGSVCVPNKCALTQTGTNASWQVYERPMRNGKANGPQGLCDSLTQGQYVCTGPPGGTYNLPAPIGGDTTAAGQQRGGQGSGANPNGPLGATGPTVNSTSQAPTQEGINPNCTLFAYAAANDTCYDFTVAFSITLKDFTSWNPILGYPDGSNCTTKFWSGYDYCVQVNGSSSTTTTSTSSQTSSTKATTSLPYPTQSGITPSCNKYAEAVSGDYCYVFAQEHNITTDELYAWNQILGPNGANCSSQFQAGVDYCVRHYDADDEIDAGGCVIDIDEPDDNFKDSDKHDTDLHAGTHAERPGGQLCEDRGSEEWGLLLCIRAEQCHHYDSALHLEPNSGV
ncbi:hypothetical protein LTR86_007479 [Recurvomyces mirabilis]|nr:hypothetical protein LTR86_007479 [Recurvomyces mirabilis]